MDTLEATRVIESIAQGLAGRLNTTLEVRASTVIGPQSEGPPGILRVLCVKHSLDRSAENTVALRQ